MKFGTNRGKRIHMVRPDTLDNTVVVSACGFRIDQLFEGRYVNQADMCGNCTRTLEYKNAVK